jgi:hypothetical protein
MQRKWFCSQFNALQLGQPEFIFFSTKVDPMAVLDHVPASSSNFLARIATTIGDFAISIAEARSRTTEMEYYTSMSDEKLASLGLARTDIARHVFRDQFFV